MLRLFRVASVCLLCLQACGAELDMSAPPQLPAEPPADDAVTEENPLFAYPVLTQPEEPRERWRLVLEGTAGAMYDDNIFTQPRDKEEDFIFTFTPDLSVMFGDFRDRKENFLLIGYSPTARFFLEHDGQNEVDHDVLFEGQTGFAKLFVDFKMRFQALSDSDIDVGTRTTRYIYSAALGNHYDLSGRTSADLDLFFSAYDYETRLDSQEAIVKGWLNYQLSPKLNTGFGVTFGYLEPEGSSGQPYEQVSFRATYTPYAKLTLKSEVGVELRQLDAGDRATPLGLVGVNYDPFDGTSIMFELSRRVRASAALSGRNYEATAALLKLRQRFFQKFFFILRTGFTNADYYVTQFDQPSDREDNYFVIRPSIEFVANKWWKMEAFYQYRKNDSNLENFAFTNHQIGVQASITF